MKVLGSIVVFFLWLLHPIYAENLRIVSLAPAITEILATLNLNTAIVGKTANCDYPESIASVTNIGAFLQISMERVFAQSPTLVLGMGQPDSPGFKKLRDQGVKVVLFEDPSKITDVYNIIRQIGILTRRENRAADVIRTMKFQVNDLKKNQPYIRPTVLVVIWHPPMTVAAGNTFIGDMVKAAGGNNSIEGGSIRYPRIDRELMLYKNPTVIVVADPLAADAVHKDVLFRLTPAAKRGFIIDDIDSNLLMRPGPRFPTAIRLLQQRFKQAVPR